MKKSQKKKIQKLQDIKYHQHKSINDGVIDTHGFPHPSTAAHSKEETRKAHELTIQIDSGLILTPKTENITNG